MTSPLRRSLQKLRAEGWICDVSEHWNPWSKTRKDLFGIADAVCFREWVTMLLQATSGANVAARLAKIRANPITKDWLWGDSRIIVVHGWRKVGPRGKAKKWECREVDVSRT